MPSKNATSKFTTFFYTLYHVSMLSTKQGSFENLYYLLLAYAR